MKIYKNICILSIILVLFMSCVGGFPAPDSVEDTLLIVLTETNVMGEFDEVLTYFEIITDKSKKVIYITPNKHICITTNLPPGEYLNLTILEKDYVSDIFERNGEALDEPKSIEVPFILKPGYITFFPIKFIYNVQSTGESDLQYYWDIELVTELDKYEALNLLKEEEGFSEWQNDFGL